MIFSYCSKFGIQFVVNIPLDYFANAEYLIDVYLQIRLKLQMF